MTDERDAIDRDDGQPPAGKSNERRPYTAPQLIDYGTVAKLTQTGVGSVNDFTGMMRMMACL